MDDVPGVYVPFTEYLDDQLPGLPLWNPHIMSGRPFEANSQSAAFSPFTWVSLALGVWRSFALVAALKLLLAALGTFLLARSLGQRFGGALLAGTVFGFSLWMVLWVAFSDASVWLWAPWLLWLTDRLVRRPGGPEVAALGLVVGLQFLGGHPESSFHVLVLCVAFFALRLWRLRGAGLARPTLAFGGALAAGGLVAAVSLVPFLELLFRSADQGQRADIASTSELAKRFALGIALPDYWGRPTQTALVRFEFGRAIYAGALPLLLAAAAPLLRPRLERVAVAAFGLGCAAVIFGVPPLFDLVAHLPVFRAAHNDRLVFAMVLCIALLAGWGLDDLAGGGRSRRTRRLVIAGGTLLVVAPALWVVGGGRAPLSVLGDALDVAWGFARPPGPLDPAAGDVVRLSSVILWVSFAAAGLVLVILRLRGRLAAGAFAALAVVLVAGDLFRAGMGQNPAIERRYATQPATGAIRYLQSRRPARFVGVGQVPQTMLPMRYGLYDARGYDLPIERRYDRLWRREVSPEFPSQAGKFLPLSLGVPALDARRLRTLSLLGVADLLQPPGDPPLSVPGLRRVYAGPDARVYANDRAVPRATVVGGQEVVTGGEAALRAVTRPGFDARRVAVTEKRIPGLTASTQPPAGEARVRAIAADSVRVARARPAAGAARALRHLVPGLGGDRGRSPGARRARRLRAAGGASARGPARGGVPLPPRQLDGGVDPQPGGSAGAGGPGRGRASAAAISRPASTSASRLTAGISQSQSMPAWSAHVVAAATAPAASPRSRRSASRAHRATPAKAAASAARPTSPSSAAVSRYSECASSAASRTVRSRSHSTPKPLEPTPSMGWWANERSATRQYS